MKAYTLPYDSFNPNEDLNSAEGLKAAREENGEDSITLALDDKGNAMIEIYFHCRLQEAVYTSGLLDLFYTDEVAHERWVNNSYGVEREQVTLDQMKALVAPLFPSVDTHSLLMYRVADDFGLD